MHDQSETSGTPRTIGISPKVLADLFVSVATFALTKYGVGLDAELAALIGKAIGTVAGFIAGPGLVGVVHDESPPDAIDLPDGHEDAI